MSISNLLGKEPGLPSLSRSLVVTLNHDVLGNEPNNNEPRSPALMSVSMANLLLFVFHCMLCGSGFRSNDAFRPSADGCATINPPRNPLLFGQSNLHIILLTTTCLSSNKAYVIPTM